MTYCCLFLSLTTILTQLCCTTVFLQAEILAADLNPEDQTCDV